MRTQTQITSCRNWVKKYTVKVKLLQETPTFGVKYEIKNARITGTAMRIRVKKETIAQSKTEKVAVMLSSESPFSLL